MNPGCSKNSSKCRKAGSYLVLMLVARGFKTRRPVLSEIYSLFVSVMRLSPSLVIIVWLRFVFQTHRMNLLSVVTLDCMNLILISHRKAYN
jgi:ABC-type amino acid transport system permease subunit